MTERPDAAPSEEVQPTDCVDCGRHYGDEYGFPDLVLPSDIWAAISPRGDGGGMLCPSCICKRLADRGLENVPAVFRSGPCFVYPPPSDTVPVAVQHYCPFSCDGKCCLKRIDCRYGLTEVAVPEECPLPITVQSKRGHNEDFEGPIDTVVLLYAHPDD
ncbi:hypothetical protein LCGC14_2952710, partial [marine sediment metagenome]